MSFQRRNNGRGRKNRNPPNYCGGQMPDFRTYPGTLDEYDIERKRALYLQSSDSPSNMDMQVGDKYTFTTVNIYIDTKGKKRVPTADELYEEILHKRNDRGYF